MSNSEIPIQNTQHAFLVAWGWFAQHLGLIQPLQAVSLKQKHYHRRPQTRVLEFLVAILAGLPHLQEISLAAHPLDKDQAVAQAWAQPAWADYSGVSRTLSGLSWEEVKQIVQVFDPFIGALDNIGGQKIGTIRFDVPGIGRSPLPRFPLRFRGLAHLISGMLDVLGHPVVDVLGISWGGALAQQFAYQYPSRCRRLILVSTSTGGISVPGRPSVLSKMLSPRRYLDPSYMAAIAPFLYGDAFRQNPDLARTYAQLIKAPLGQGYFGQLLAGVGWTSIHWLHRLRQPTLILAGKDDVIVPPINARILARLIPRATLHIFNGGHLFALTEKEQVASLVHAFLRNG